MTGFSEADVPDQSGKCFIVTGANTGLGFEVARVLAGKGARVLLACRDAGKAGEAIGRIGAGEMAHLPLDLADLASVRAAAEAASSEPRIDGLINNAGVMIPPLVRTAQGFESQFGINHLGHFALTALLLPKLAATPGSRVVVTASLAHKRGQIYWDNLNAEQGYNRGNCYGQSKLANMLYFAELDRRLRAAGLPVSALGCHPGVAATDLMRNTGWFRPLTPLLGVFLNTAAKGAWPALQAACDPAAKGGEYFGPQGLGETRGASGLATRTADAQDAGLARRLWDVSVEMTGIDPGLAPA
jgi:NAD(P)-dependent dehydrogenase (short-subunit alcohol dehydrogenase family)